MLNCFIYRQSNCYSIVYTGYEMRHPAGFWCADAAISSICTGFLEYVKEHKSICNIIEAKTEKGYFSVTVTARKGDFYAGLALASAFDAFLYSLKAVEKVYTYACSLHIDEPASADFGKNKRLSVNAI